MVLKKNSQKLLDEKRVRALVAEYRELIENLRHWDRVFWQAAYVFLIFWGTLLSASVIEPKIRISAFCLFLFSSVALCEIYFRTLRTAKERIKRVLEIEAELGLKQYHMLEAYKRSRKLHKFFPQITWLTFWLGVLTFWIYFLIS